MHKVHRTKFSGVIFAFVHHNILGHTVYHARSLSFPSTQYLFISPKLRQLYVIKHFDDESLGEFRSAQQGISD